ncbi:MAG: hypothetical protein IJN89_06475 [Anaerotignum sp.]|nr:hypothetical protein [Anaerotignum sp.]
MEKERKGLYGRLLDFWREKFDMGETDSIGFWHEKEGLGQYFSEMGAVASLTQEETKRIFRQEEKESVLEEVSSGEIFFAEKNLLQKEEEYPRTEKREEKLFSEGMFWVAKENEDGENWWGKPFLRETPEKETEKRSILPVMGEMEQEKEKSAEEAQEMPGREERKKEEQQADPVIDIEKLMQQITKKLWEERESCGRRLR